MAEEPGLPHLPSVSWNERTQSFSNNPRKRVRTRRSSNAPPLFSTSSDPAIFSSDDDPALDNYLEGRRKKRYVGSWYQQQPTSSDSSFEESQPLPKPKRTLKRHFDSGVWMGSDGTDGDESIEDFDPPMQSKLPQLARVAVRQGISPAEEAARQKIQICIEDGNEDVDLSSMGLEHVSNATIGRLSELSCIPLVTKGVPFEPKDPSIKLYLSGNLLARVPGAIFDLEHLTVLTLRGCGLKELPPAICKLTNLETLNLSQNSLRYLPAELLDLIATPSNMRNLLLQGNDFYQPDRLPHQIQSKEELDAWEEHQAQEYESDGSDSPDSEDEQEPLIDMRLLNELLGRHEKVLVHQAPSTIDSIGARYLSRSPIQYSDSTGIVYSQFRFDREATTSIPVEGGPSDVPSSTTPSSVPYHSKSVARTVLNPQASRVPSLLELTLRSCSRSQLLSELTFYAPDSPPHLRRLLECASEQRESGGLTCSQCKKLQVVPTTQWVEWWEVARLHRDSEAKDLRFTAWSDIQQEKAIPFMWRGCSWKCVPETKFVGEWLTQSDSRGPSEA